MSIPTLAPHPLGDDTPLDREARTAGLADVYDDHHAGTPLTVLEGRLQQMTAHLNQVGDAYVAYVFGYASAVISLRLHQQATTDVQSQIAHEDQENDR